MCKKKSFYAIELRIFLLHTTNTSFPPKQGPYKNGLLFNFHFACVEFSSDPSHRISLNFLLHWLIWTKTPKEMRVHSRILLQTCFVDLIFLCLNLIASPINIFHGSFTVILLDGFCLQTFASIFNYDPLCIRILGVVLSVCLYFDIFSISVQFVYRYLVLTRNMKIGLGKYLLMLIAPFIAALIPVILFILLTIRVPINEELKSSLNDYIDWDNSIYNIVDKNSEIIWATEFLFIIIAYSINIFCGVKLVKFVHAHAFNNPRKKELNQQLTKTLIILAFYPFLAFLAFTIISAFIVTTRMMTTANKEMAEKIIVFALYFSLIIANWLPTINPIISIWINRPYRDAVKQFIDRLFKKNNSITPVQPLS